jgi:hypothetical protein
MVCTCSQCTASDYDAPRDDSWLDVKPAPHEIRTPEQDRERLMTALRSIEESMPRPVSYSYALNEYQRRSQQSLGEWLAENMRERQVNAK